MATKEMTVKEKKALEEGAKESIRPGRVFVPAVDILENEEEIIILADMPGVTGNFSEIFETATDHLAYNHIMLAAATIEEGHSEKSFMASLKDKKSEKERRDKWDQQRIATQIMANNFTQQASAFLGERLEGLYKTQDELNGAIAETEAAQQKLAENIDTQEGVVAEAEAKVDDAQTDVAAKEADVQQAEQFVEGAEMSIEQTFVKLASAENQTSIVYDSGLIDGTPKMYFKDDSGNWTQATEDPSGNVILTPISDEEASKFQSSEYETDMYLRGVLDENPDGTSTVKLRGSGPGVENEDITADQQKFIDAYETQTNNNIKDLGAPDDSFQAARNYVSGSFMGMEKATQTLTQAQTSLITAQGNLATSVRNLEAEQEKLQQMVDEYEGGELELTELKQQLADNKAEIEATKDLNQQLENGDFDSEKDMLDAMPEDMRADYIKKYGISTPENDAKATIIVSASATPTATSHASQMDGEDPDQLTSQTAFTGAADPNQQVPAPEQPVPETQDPTVKEQQQSLGM